MAALGNEIRYFVIASTPSSRYRDRTILADAAELRIIGGPTARAARQRIGRAACVTLEDATSARYSSTSAFGRSLGAEAFSPDDSSAPT
jgi:hypothetical protein